MNTSRRRTSYVKNPGFSDWIRENLPPSSNGFLATDIDFFLFNIRTKEAIMVETKCYKSDISEWQRRLYEDLSQWLKDGMDGTGWTIKGWRLLQFEGTSPYDGRVWLDGKEVSEEELILALSL